MSEGAPKENMNSSHTITEITRQSVCDHFGDSGVDWAGRLEEHDFLGRLYDLESLPSNDGRYKDALEDIARHRAFNRDGSDDWVFYDPRFNLFEGSDAEFMRFLVETVHPAVRPNTAEASQLVEALNEMLTIDGWSLVERQQISRKPVYAASRIGVRAAAFEESTGWEKVDRQLSSAKTKLDAADTEEDFQGVGLLCREVLISLGQEVYDPGLHLPQDGVQPSRTDADRMLAAFLDSELAGGANQAARAHGKAALNLAVALQHKRTADWRIAALCLEASASVTNLVAILAGRRG